MKTDRRWYLTRDGRAVEEGNPDAARLLVAKGMMIPDALARKHGIHPDQLKAREEKAAEVEAPVEVEGRPLPVMPVPEKRRTQR